jgi:cell division protein FtsQ
VIALGAGYRFWLRDSSLVAVTQVKVAGAEGPEAAAVTNLLKHDAKGMSTLNADEAKLTEAVAGFPTVAGIDVETNFPHGMTVTVDSRPPVVLVDVAGHKTPVAGDGTVLTGVDKGRTELPVIKLDRMPAGAKVTGDALAESIVLGGAPDPLRSLIDRVRFKGEQGVVVTLAGLPVIFGTSEKVQEKWTALSATLADPSLSSLSYLDVRVPERPAAGGAGDTVADAPDPTTTAVPTDVVPEATTETTVPTDPTIVAPTVTETDPAVGATATVDPAVGTTPSTTTPPATDPTVTATDGSAVGAGGVAP